MLACPRIAGELGAGDVFSAGRYKHLGRVIIVRPRPFWEEFSLLERPFCFVENWRKENRKKVEKNFKKMGKRVDNKDDTMV